MGKKYTYEEVEKEFDNRGYDLISNEYINCTTKLDYICRKHHDKGIQQITFTKFHHESHGCYYCGRERTEASRRTQLNIEEDKKLCGIKNFTYVSSYKDGYIYYIEFICNNHRELGTQRMRKCNMKRDIKGCQYCSGKNLPEWYVMMKKDEINPNIKILEPYVNMTTPMKCICLKHNCETNKTMQNILSGSGCYYCGIEKLSEKSFLSNEQVNINVHKKNPHIDLIEYNGAGNYSRWHCNKHNIDFDKYYNTLINCQSGCSECYKEMIRKRDGMGYEEFCNRLKEVHPQLIPKSDYVNNSTEMNFHCNEHDFDFSLTPAAVLSRLSCCPKSRVTYKEETMCELLESWGYLITRQKTFEGCEDKRLLAFDCYLNDFNICIEYDGEQHYRPVRFGEESDEEMMKKFNYTKYHDEIKNNFCKENNIGLIRVPYYEFDYLENFMFDQLCKHGAIIEY